MLSPLAGSHAAPRFTLRGRLLTLALICLGALALPPSAFGRASADLTVTKSGDESAPVGGTITYSLVVTNGGPDAAADVVLTDPLPAHTAFVSADSPTGGTVSFMNNTLTVSFGPLAAFESGTATLVLTVNGDTPRNTTISNTATVTSSTPDPEPSNDSATAVTVVTGPFPGDLLVSEFRLRGPGGAEDEYVELYNNSDAPHVVRAVDGSEGYALAASDGAVRCTIPNDTRLPAHGHYLCVNSDGYTLSAYPAGDGTTATGDATFQADIPDNAGLALFRTANTSNFTTANRLDAVGSTAETNALYKEGMGYPALPASAIDYAFYRDLCGKGGSITAAGPCPSPRAPKDTGSNASDFIFVDTAATSTAAGRRRGAPGPENFSGPTQRNTGFAVVLLDTTKAASAPPNRVRDTTPDPVNNSASGTLDIRRRVFNATGFPVTRLRFRIVDLTTTPAPAGYADLRARTSLLTVAGDVNDPATCAASNGAATTPCTVTVQGTTLEQPPLQLQGGGFNSSLSAGTVTMAKPLQPGESVNLRFLFGVQQTGTFKFYINIEASTDEGQGGGGEALRPALRAKAARKK